MATIWRFLCKLWRNLVEGPGGSRCAAANGRFLCKLWRNLVEGLKKAFPLLAAIVGVALILYANFSTNQTPLDAGLQTVGVTTLGAGVFSAMLKYFQFIGVFKSAFEELLKSKSAIKLLVDYHVNCVKQHADIYEHVAHRNISMHYPELEDDFRAASDDYGDGEFDYYMDSYKRTIIIKAFDETTRTIDIEDESIYDIVTSSNDAKVSFGFQLKPAGTYEVHHLTIDGVDCRGDLKSGPDEVMTFARQLTGKKRYGYHRRVAQKCRLMSDPSKIQIFGRLCRQPSVRIQNEVAKAIQCKFESLNLQRTWSPSEAASPTARSDQTYVLQGLSFAHQGYYISISQR